MKIEQRLSKYLITFQTIEPGKDVVMSICRATLEEWRDEITNILDTPEENYK